MEIPGLHNYGPVSYTTHNNIKLGYVSLGEPTAIPIIMIIGLACSHQLWNPRLINHLLQAKYRVILFDNRDSGVSTKMTTWGIPWIRYQYCCHRLRLPVKCAYTLDDMAEDVLAIMNANNIVYAHLIGLSLGGMIAQQFACRYPERTLSLVSLMSSTGARNLPRAKLSSFKNIVKIMRNVYKGNREFANNLEKAGICPEGMLRQITAMWNAGDRSVYIKNIDVPTLVQHGEDDTLLPQEHALHTASLIFGSCLKIYPGLGHDLSEEKIVEIAADMLIHFEMLKPINCTN